MSLLSVTSPVADLAKALEQQRLTSSMPDMAKALGEHGHPGMTDLAKMLEEQRRQTSGIKGDSPVANEVRDEPRSEGSSPGGKEADTPGSSEEKSGDSG